MPLPGDDLLKKFSDFRTRRKDFAELKRQVDNIEKGIQMDLLDGSSLRALGAIFVDDDEETVQADFFKRPASRRAIKAASDHVQEQLESLSTYSNLRFGTVRNVVDEAQKSLMRMFFGFGLGGLARLGAEGVQKGQDIFDRLLQFGPTTFETPDRQGRASPEEIGQGVRELVSQTFSPSMIMARVAGQEEFTAQIDQMLMETEPLVLKGQEISPSIQQAFTTAQGIKQSRGTAAQWADIAGSFAGVGAMFLVRPDIGLSKFPALMNLANKTLAGRTGLATSGLTAVAGMIGYGTAPDDAEFMDRVTRAATTMGGISFIGSILVGRPYGQATRILQRVQESAGFKDASALQKLHFRLGVAASFHPRMTVGQMANVGAIGAGIMTGEHLTSGSSVKDSVYEGAKASFDWMGYDFFFTRLGNLNKLVDIQTRFSARLHKNLEALDFLPDRIKQAQSIRQIAGGPAAGKAADLASVGVAGVTGAGITSAFGAGLSFLSGEDPVTGAAAGAVAGAGLFGFSAAVRRAKLRKEPVPPGILQEAKKRMKPEELDALRDQWRSRLETVLPPEFVIKLETGAIEQLTHKEAQEIASLIVSDSWQHALMDEGVEAAHQIIGRRVSGQRIIVDDLIPEERALYLQQSALIRKTVEFENTGVPIWDPEHLDTLIKLAAHRRRLAQLFREKDIDPAQAFRQDIKFGGKLVSLDEAILQGRRMHRRMLTGDLLLAPGRKDPTRQGVSAPGYASSTVKLLETRRTLDNLLRTPAVDIIELQNFVKSIEGTLTKGGKSGNVWTLNVPGIQRLKGKAVRSLLERFRELMNDTPPMQKGTTVGAFAAPGLMLFSDPLDDGEEGVGIFPNDAGLVALAALGMVIMRGRGIRVRGFTKQTRRILRTANNKFGKEAVVTVNVAGDVKVRLGTEGGVDIVKAGEPVIIVSIHNQPAQKGSLGGINVRNILPSAKDVSAIQLAAPAGRRDAAIGAVLSPGNSMITVFRLKPSLAGRVSFDPGTQAEVIKSLEDMQLRSFEKMLGTLGIKPKGNLDSLYTIATENLGADAVVRTLVSEVFEPAGIEVLVNVSDNLFDALVARHLRSAQVRPEMDLASAVRALSLKGSPAMEIAERVRDPKISKRLTEIDRGQPKTKLDTTANRVAPAGSGKVKKPLSSTITAQEVSGMTDDLKTAQAVATKHNLNLNVETVEGSRKFVLRSSDGEEIASDTSVRRVRKKLHTAVAASDQIKAAAAEGKVLDPSQTDVGVEFVVAQGFGVLGAGIGAPLGGVAQQVFAEKDGTLLDRTAAGAIVGALTGYVLATAAAYKGARFRVSPGAARALQLVRPDVKLMTPAQAEKKLGRAGVTTDEFHSFPTVIEAGKDFQTTHILRRLDADASLKGKKDKDKQAAIAHMLAKFVPSVVSLDTLDAIQAGVVKAGKATGMSNPAISRLWNGYLNQISIGPSVRKDFARLNITKTSLGDPTGPLSSIQVMDDLKSVLVNAEVISGPASPASEAVVDVVKEIRARRTQSITPEAAELKAVTDLTDVIFTMSTSGPGAKPDGMIGAGLRPARSIWNAGRTISLTHERDGNKIMEIYQAVVASVEANSREWSRADAELKALFAGTTVQERKWVRLLQEGDREKTAAQWRAHFENKNDRIIHIADTQKRMQEKIAREVLGDANFDAWKIEDYFQHYYTQRTVRELKKSNILPNEPVFMPESTGWSQVKFWRSAFPRRFEEPVGPIIEDALEAGQMLMYGAIRKKWIDKILVVANGEVLTELSKRQPFVAQAMARWVADIHGVPRASTVRARVILENLGLNFEERFPDMGPWGRALMDKYFEKFQPKRISQMIRGWSMLSKIGYVVTSPMVNLTQLLVNTGANVGMHSLFMGTIYAGAGKAVAIEKLNVGTGLIGGAVVGGSVGALVGDEEGALIGAAIGAGLGAGIGQRSAAVRDMEMGTAREIAITSPWPHPFVQGKVYRALAEEGGVMSQAFRKELDRATKATADPLRSTLQHFGTKTLAAGAAGAVVGATVFEDEAQGALFGAAAGAAAQVRLLKIAGQHVKNNALIMFNFAESTNRIVSAAATAVEHKGIVRAERKIAAGVPRKNMENIFRVQDTVESAALGAAVAGGTAATFADEGERLEAAGEFAGYGALFGGVLGAISHPRKLRMMEEIEQFKALRPMLQKLNTQLVQEGPPTSAETLRWLMAQHTQMTQFQFGSASRGSFLRTPFGESMFALQTYTLNQAEFLGSLLGDFTRSMHKGAGHIDTRIFRHLMLLMGAGSVMTALYGFTGDERGSEYWISRIGFGLMPFVIWNESAQSWNMTNIISQFGGPFASDVTRVAGSYFSLVTDPAARADWTQNIDKVFSQIIPSLNQIRNTPERIGATLDSLGQQGVAELARGQKANALALGSPLTTIRGRTPTGEGGPAVSGGGPGANRTGGGLGDLGDLGGL